MAPKLMEDESGVNILIEYVMNFAIMLILFTIVLLTYQSLMTQSNNTTTEQQLKVIANDVANKITLFDSIISSSENHGETGTGITSLSQTFDTQPQISGQTYYIDIHYDPAGSYIEVHTSDTNVVPVRAGFKTNHPVQPVILPTGPKVIQSSSLSHTISYSTSSGNIEVS